MSKRGKTPSLIGGGAGASKFVVARRVRRCRRCDVSMRRGSHCVEVKIPGKMGSKTYCLSCFRDVLERSREDLNVLARQVNDLVAGASVVS